MPSSHPRRRASLRAFAAPASAGALVLTLTGCIGAPAPSPTPTPSSSADPIFATDEEALAAAEAAYSAFEDVSQSIAADGGEKAERIGMVATPAYAEELLDEFAQYRELGIRAEGSASVDSLSLVERHSIDGKATVSIYVCRDVSGIRVIDTEGVDVTPSDRKSRTPLVASLVAEDGADGLLVDKVELWSGDDFC